MRTGSQVGAFRNWAGNQVCLPAERLQPASTAEVAAIVARAAAGGVRVKAVGAGHSFTATACTDGILLNLDRMNAVRHVDTERCRVRVQAGIRLVDLNERLAEVGLAMPNLGDIAYQSVAGAIGTATHGTGLRLGNLATTIVAMEIVTGTGEVLQLDDEHEPELLRVARVGVGALGIVTEVTIQCVPTFNLHVTETVERLDDLIDGWSENIAANDHFEFFWIPGTDRAQVKRNNRTDRPAEPPSKVSYFRDKILLENVAFGAVCRIGRRFPRAVPAIVEAISSGVSERELVDRSDRVFASPRHVRFYEMEYGIPVEALPEALARVRDFTGGLGMPILFPVEVRCSAADDIPLSTANGRTSAWIAVHVYQGTSYDAYFGGIERILDDYDGRPHWGKLHFQRASTLEARYPEWSTFIETRHRLDPDGTFANAYLDRVIGPVDRR
jgi:L-gulonolactone oxidase